MGKLIASFTRFASLLERPFTWFGSSSDIPLRRATWHKQQLLSEPGIVRRGDKPGPFLVRPDEERVPFRAQVHDRFPDLRMRCVR
jgi:hypothetical protein